MERIIATHYPNDENFILDRAREYAQEEYHPFNTYGKPEGLWISFEDDVVSWSSWCTENDFGILNTGILLDITALNLLVINNIVDANIFKEKYSDQLNVIKWQSVVQDYDGIIIPSYLCQLRMHRDHRWYYAWDCASGCIWNVEKIEVVENK
jgi:hypothetical protein